MHAKPLCLMFAWKGPAQAHCCRRAETMTKLFYFVELREIWVHACRKFSSDASSWHSLNGVRFVLQHQTKPVNLLGLLYVSTRHVSQDEDTYDAPVPKPTMLTCKSERLAQELVEKLTWRTGRWSSSWSFGLCLAKHVQFSSKLWLYSRLCHWRQFRSDLVAQHSNWNIIGLRYGMCV